ncbi:MAG: ATP-binding protein, partial [Anaerolineales bacterium]
ELAHYQPLLIILEDIHWASETTLTWLHRLTRHLLNNPILVIATYRREEVHPGSLLDNWMFHLKQNKLSNQLELKPLSRSAMEDWLSTAEDKLLNQIYNWSDGNPFFALETLRVLFEKGWLKIVDGQLIKSLSSTSLPIPASVKQTISMRLDQFSSFTRQAADAAAVIGHAFDFELLQKVLEQDEDNILAALDHLLRGYIIHEQSNFPGPDYAFEHHLVREVILERMHPNRRQRYHRLIAKALTGQCLTQPRSNSEIAYHYESGGEYLSAIEYYKKAAQDAANVFAWQEVERIQGRILEIITRLDPQYMQPDLLLKRGEVLTERAYLRFIQGRMNEKDEDLSELHRLVEISCSDALHLLYLIQQARYCNLEGQFDQALEMTKEGLMLAERLNDTNGRCHFLTQAGFAHYFLGDYPAALATLQTALPLCPELSSLRGETLSFLSYTSYLIADYKASLDYRQQALQIHTVLGERDQEAIDLTDIGILYTQLNHLSEAEYYLNNGLSLAHKISSQVAESYAMNNLGNLEYIYGRYSDALDYFDQSLVLQRATGSRRGEASALSNMGMTLAAIGDYGNAEALLRQAISIQEEINYSSGLASGLTYLARILINLENYDDALETLRRAKEISLSIGDLDTQNSALISLSWLYLQQDKLKEAQKAATEAYYFADNYSLMENCIFALAILGLACLRCGEDSQAYTCTTQAISLLEEQGNIEGPEEAVYLAHYHILQGLNRSPEAALALQKFQEWVKRKADAINNPDQRRSYLKNWVDLTFHL